MVVCIASLEKNHISFIFHLFCCFFYYIHLIKKQLTSIQMCRGASVSQISKSCNLSFTPSHYPPISYLSANYSLVLHKLKILSLF